ncbi:MAG: heavy-metal-associated domain-containing protein [Ruminiclostridium sp.]
MATGIIVGIIIAVCIFAVKSYTRKLAHGCCGSGGDNEKSQAHKADLSGYKYRYTVTIGGMSCKNCAARIENSFNRQEGTFAQVDYKGGTAEIYSETPVTDISLRQRIIGLGYSVERIEENELRM